MAGRARHWILALYLASAVFVTVQQGVVGRSNNFKVFRAAAVNLLAHRDLYAAHPDPHFDFYKYSPSFALLFAPFAALPFAAALLIWSLLNSLLLWYAVRRLLPDRQATLALALVYPEVLFAMQYTQSNGLVTALILLAFLALEQGRELRAALLIGIDTFVKIFPLGAAVLALCYPRRWGGDASGGRPSGRAWINSKKSPRLAPPCWRSSTPAAGASRCCLPPWA